MIVLGGSRISKNVGFAPIRARRTSDSDSQGPLVHSNLPWQQGWAHFLPCQQEIDWTLDEIPVGDPARPALAWARRNAELNGLSEAPVGDRAQRFGRGLG